MVVIAIHPRLTIGAHEEAQLFYDFFQDELYEHADVRSIKSFNVLEETTLTSDDVIVFFFRSDKNYSIPVQEFLFEATKKTCKILPVSIDKSFRVPPISAIKSQSYDVEEHLRNRALTKANLSTIASAFSRNVLSEIQPTLIKDRMHLFISHRRLDGEELAAALCKSLRQQAESVFRDLIDIKVGEDAQEIIEENLSNSDAVIFLDTPKSYESEWIAKELKMAISMNLPIVWVKIGNHNEQNQLKVTPLGKPHFVINEISSLETKFDPDLVNRMIDEAFKISREHTTVLFDQFRKLKSLAKANDLTIKQVNKKLMLYEVHIPRKPFRYWQRPMTHLIQLYGRFPKHNDKKSFRPLASEYGYEHPALGSFYDSAIMLAPIQSRNMVISTTADNCYVDSIHDYINSLESYLETSSKNKLKKRGIIISGAFPDCDPTYQQYLSNAVHSITQAILEHSGIVILGGHPTFQYPILEMAKRTCPVSYKEVIHLYISKWFVTDQNIAEMNNHSKVFPIKAANSREDSLTQLRKTMINDEEARALIVMGGKTTDGGHMPGVDEEISLARRAGIPVFIIGSVGGRSGELAAELDKNNWEETWNELTVEENRLIMTSLDYSTIAKLILTKLGF
ncbi:toll/interleukin-1 receptor domain-containing protein [Brevibacillus nitrificans]|uniref:Toll/interleukin-1 receptor domain-containing protein n=1 Tax=Brevibacillus nitrificans TaxID=651560 RepID=A0A3M8D523_9BACL|nr:toll/interleukin-1 receptor domain-containing protein [Brevibacillus nitrificans]RNB83196.1 toll/interleukin-1 receptor domain-containing protein [Brevibacillus nitrificans]